MDWKQISGLVVGVVIGALLLTTLVMPVVSDATATEKTFTNEGYFRMTHYDTDTDITLTWTAENPMQVIVNDVVVPINYDVAGSVTIVADTSFIARLNTTTSNVSLSFIGPGGGTHTATVAATYTFSGGNATIVNTTDTDATYTTTYTDLYIPSLDGEFVMKKYDESAYINEDSYIFAYGLTRIKNSTGTIASPGAGFEFSGSIADGIEGRVWRGTDNVTVSNEQINYVADDKFIDLYKFDAITATATYHETIDDEPVTTDTTVTYNYLLVPHQVTAEYAEHLNDETNAILSMVPLLITVGIIMAVVGLFVIRRE